MSAGPVDLVVAGAGMAGLAAGARAAELGARVRILEKGVAPGGSLLLSSGVVWRYRDLETFRAECPGGDPALQRTVLEHTDAAVGWLRALGAPVAGRQPANPLTFGVRFLPAGLVETLVRLTGGVETGAPLAGVPEGVPLVLATGGFHASAELVRRWVTPEADHVIVRGGAHSTGDGLRVGLDRGARLTDGLDEFYGRAMPAPPADVPPGAFVRLAQVYARHARVVDEQGVEREGPVTWSETEVARWIARRPGATAWLVVPRAALAEPAPGGTVGGAIEAARAAGGAVEDRGDELAVRVVAGVTTTLGGLAVDADARVLGADGAPLPGLYAAGADAGGVSLGGWSSGLAAALVLGRIAAERALGHA